MRTLVTEKVLLANVHALGTAWLEHWRRSWGWRIAGCQNYCCAVEVAHCEGPRLGMFIWRATF